MSEPLEPRDDLGDIRRLVSTETEGALRQFRAGNFEANLRARIAAADRAAGEAPRRLLRLHPLGPRALAAALVLLLAGAAFLLLHRGPQVGSGESRVFVKAVGLLPGLESIAAGPAGAPQGTRPVPEPVGPVASVLGQAYAEKKAEEDRTAPVTSPSAPHFSLKKKMEILFKDRVLERVLFSIHERSKEV